MDKASDPSTFAQMIEVDVTLRNRMSSWRMEEYTQANSQLCLVWSISSAILRWSRIGHRWVGLLLLHCCFSTSFCWIFICFSIRELAEVVYVQGRAPVFWHYALLWLKETVLLLGGKSKHFLVNALEDQEIWRQTIIPKDCLPACDHQLAPEGL